MKASRLDPPLFGAVHRPGVRFLLSHPAHVVALGFGSGLSPFAPGTVGTLAAWLAHALLSPWLNDAGWGATIGIGVLVGWWACAVTARHLALADPTAIVWDEVIGFWIVLWLLTPAPFWSQAAAFVVFRVLDAAKPGPMAWADNLFRLRERGRIGWAQGFGILFDDLVAALCTLLIIAAWRLV